MIDFTLEQKRFEKMKRSGLKKCPGHWINKGLGIRQTDNFNEKGQCDRCGGWRRTDENKLR